MPNSPYGTGVSLGMPRRTPGEEPGSSAGVRSRGQREQHPRAVRRPADDAIAHRIVREAPAAHPGSRHDKDVHVPVVRCAIGPCTVRRKARKRFFAGRRCQTNARRPSSARPDVPRVDEGDLVLEDGRLSKHRASIVQMLMSIQRRSAMSANTRGFRDGHAGTHKLDGRVFLGPWNGARCSLSR